ncbi:MAG: HEPN domain-containing protein [Nanoarchaeota archaeon]|nr:HEPN domain-containing protein [Nanoarchaeota archaeon]
MSDKLKKCFKEGEKGKRHKGLRKIEIDDKRFNNHLFKAEHNLKAVIYLKKGGFSDWSASACFYCLYHCLLALCIKYGYESRNQSCTFALIEDLIDRGKIKNISKDDLKEIFNKSIDENLEHSDKILDIRERMQYSTETHLEDKEFQRLFERVKVLFSKLKKEVER